MTWLAGLNVRVLFVFLTTYKLRGKRPTLVILENHGCKFTHSWEMAVKLTCVCVFFLDVFRTRVQIPDNPTWSARCCVIAMGKLCTRSCSGQLSLLPFAGWEMSTGTSWGRNGKSCDAVGPVFMTFRFRSLLAHSAVKGMSSHTAGLSCIWVNLHSVEYIVVMLLVVCLWLKYALE
jgi:hypothetical protein